MCRTPKPKVQPIPPPMQPVSPVTEDEAVLRESQRERRRAASRSGRQSTVMAGNSAQPPTAQNKTILGA